MNEDPANQVVNPAEDPQRIRQFANFFSNYINVSAIVLAALPIPVAAWELIPIFEAQKGTLETVTPIICFLVFAYIFFNRHDLASRMFPDPNNWWANGRSVWILLTILLVVGLVLLYVYYAVLFSSVDTLTTSSTNAQITSEILENTQLTQIPNGLSLVASFVGFFTAIEGALVLMALKEYAQTLLGISDRAIIREKGKSQEQKTIEEMDRSNEALVRITKNLLNWCFTIKTEQTKKIADKVARDQRAKAIKRQHDEIIAGLKAVRWDGDYSETEELIEEFLTLEDH